MLAALWRFLLEGLDQAFEGPDWSTRVHSMLSTLKKHLRTILCKEEVQTLYATYRALRKRVPYTTKFAWEVRPEKKDEQEAYVRWAGLHMKTVLLWALQQDLLTLVPSDPYTVHACRPEEDAYDECLERLWAVWLSTPFLCSVDVPMLVKGPNKKPYLRSGATLKDPVAQKFWCSKMLHSAMKKDKHKANAPPPPPPCLRLYAPADSEHVRIRPSTLWTNCQAAVCVSATRTQFLVWPLLLI
jgi:hypothetical protein